MDMIHHGIRELRDRVIHGRCIDLIPYREQHAEAVVRLRNLPESTYFLNQSFVSTLETQNQWFRSYQQRNNDIFWVIQDKNGRIVGTNRLYDITETQAEKGSQIVEQKFGRSSPIALESELIILCLAFIDIGVGTVIARIRCDNQKVQSMNARLGFRESGSESVRGVAYSIYRLDKPNFHPDPLYQIVDYWSKRGEHRQA